MADRVAPAPLDIGQTEIGFPADFLLMDRYRIQRQLGMGGMGRVYLAMDEKLGIPVAVKVLREVLSRDPSSVKRLILEARHSMLLAHPNVVRVHNFEDGEMTKFLVMEYVEGKTLADLLAERGRLPEEEVRRIAVEICKGLAHAHEQKVIHRDIKPGNILIRRDGAVKIADFGIARECRDSVSRLTSQLDSGTLLYMSPEQLIGKSSEASDIYSLGVVLYEMLAGEPPFRSGDITYQIRELEPEPLQGASPGMCRTVMKCLAKKSERRFATVAGLREELEGKTEPDSGKELQKPSVCENVQPEMPVPLAPRCTVRVNPPRELALRERRMGPVDPALWLSDTLTVSPDSRRAAWVTKVSGLWGLSTRYAVVVDGAKDKIYANVSKSLRFSPNSRRVGYSAQVRDGWTVVIDGEEGTRFVDVGTGAPTFSPDSRRVAYCANLGNLWAVVTDGEVGKLYSGISAGSPVFSPDSRRLAYGARNGEGWVVVVDGASGRACSAISAGTPIFSPDSRRVAYGALVGDKWSVVVDGNEGKAYSDIGTNPVKFSPDSRHLTYGGHIAGHWVVVVDGEEGRRYLGIGADDPIFSPAGNRVAYSARTGDKWVVVVDGEEGKPYAGIAARTPIFSPDGKRVAYGARVGDPWMVVVDGEEGKPYAGIMDGSPIFSPDSRRVAYGARSGDQWVVVVDGQEGKAYSGIGSGGPIFSPDSSRVAYSAKIGDLWAKVVDGEEGKPYSVIGAGDPIFSPDSQRTAYSAKVGDRWVVVVDGVEGTGFGSPMRGGQITFETAQQIRWLAIRGNDTFRMTADIIY